MVQILSPSAGLGATAAYRRDVAPRDGNAPFGANDGVWLMVGALVDHAARANAEDAATLLREAAELARPAMELSERFIFVGRIDDPDCRSDAEIIQRLVHCVEEPGAFQLALAMLDSLLVTSANAAPLVYGRVLAHRAKVLWKIGEIERSAAAYVMVGKLGKQHGEPELIVRSRIGTAILARHRGDVAIAGRAAALATKLARQQGLPRLERVAVAALFVAAAQARRFDEALVQGWRLYELGAGDPISHAEVLGNLGMLLWDAGHPAPSRAALRAVLSGPMPAGVAFAALGGFALASAALDDAASVRWAARETERLARETPIPFHVATAMAECAAAQFVIGDNTEGQSSRNIALNIAVAHNMRDVAERAAGLGPSHRDIAVTRFELTSKASRVARKIESLQPLELPRHVRLVVAA